MVLLNSFTTSMYKRATNKLHFKVGIMMGKKIIIYRTGYRKQTYY